MSTGTPEFLVPPAQDSLLRKQLIWKREEYRKRMVGKGTPWERFHPYVAYIQFHSYRDNYYKERVLTAVLLGEPEYPIATWKLGFDLGKEHGPLFDLGRFKNACGVAAYYLGNSSVIMLTKGTGLRNP
jgi:hypothetical protein